MDSLRMEECIPDLPLNARQLYWLGFALDWCTMGDGYRRYSSYTQMLSSSVVGNHMGTMVTIRIRMIVSSWVPSPPRATPRRPGG